MRRPGFGGILSTVVVLVGILLSLVVWGVSTLLIEKWDRRRPRRSLLDPSEPYQPTSVADEAQRWLEQQS